MANTVATSGVRIMLSTIDSDWNLQDTFSDLDKIHLNNIMFVPGAANDILVVRDGAIDGPVIMYVEGSATTDQRILYGHGMTCNPYIYESECTLSS